MRNQWQWIFSSFFKFSYILKMSILNIWYLLLQKVVRQKYFRNIGNFENLKKLNFKLISLLIFYKVLVNKFGKSLCRLLRSPFKKIPLNFYFIIWFKWIIAQKRQKWIHKNIVYNIDWNLYYYFYSVKRKKHIGRVLRKKQCIH